MHHRLSAIELHIISELNEIYNALLGITGKQGETIAKDIVIYMEIIPREKSQQAGSLL